MHRSDQEAFFRALNTMGAFFGDELSELRQRVYWEIFAHVSLEAWEYACMQVMTLEGFHKVPLPAVLMPHVRVFVENLRHAERLREEEQHRLLTAQVPLSPVMPREEAIAHIKTILSALEGKAWPTRLAVHHLPEYQEPLPAEQAEARRALLKAQAARIQHNGRAKEDRDASTTD